MNIDAESAARPVSSAATARLTRMRQASLAVLVLLVVEYGLACMSTSMRRSPATIMAMG